MGWAGTVLGEPGQTLEASMWNKKPCSCYSASVESPTSGTEEWLARAGFFSCNMILVFSIIFLVFRNNIYDENLSSSETLLIWSLPFLSHPSLTPSETLHSEKLDLTEICRFRCLMSSPPSSFYFFSEDLQQDMCSPISTLPDMTMTDNQKDLTLQVFKKNTKMIYIRSLLQEYTITRTDKRKCTNQ